jgi:DME family drug/metabolite transporter
MTAGLLWGTGGLTGSVFGRVAGLPALTVAAYRLTAGGVLLVAFLLAARRPLPRGRAAWTRVTAFGLLAAEFQACYFTAVSLTSVSLATLVTIGGTPVIVQAVRWLRGHRAVPREMAATGLALAGLGLLVGLPSDHLTEGATLGGAALALAAALGFATMTLTGGTPVPGLDDLATTGFAFTLGGGVLMMVAAVAGHVVFAPMPDAIGLLVALGTGPTAVAYTSYFRGLRLAAPGTAALMSLLEPLTGTILAVLLLGNRLSAAGIAGAVILGAALLLTVPARRLPRDEQRPLAERERGAQVRPGHGGGADVHRAAGHAAPVPVDAGAARGHVERALAAADAEPPVAGIRAAERGAADEAGQLGPVQMTVAGGQLLRAGVRGEPDERQVDGAAGGRHPADLVILAAAEVQVPAVGGQPVGHAAAPLLRQGDEPAGERRAVRADAAEGILAGPVEPASGGSQADRVRQAADQRAGLPGPAAQRDVVQLAGVECGPVQTAVRDRHAGNADAADVHDPLGRAAGRRRAHDVPACYVIQLAWPSRAGGCRRSGQGRCGRAAQGDRQGKDCCPRAKHDVVPLPDPVLPLLNSPELS